MSAIAVNMIGLQQRLSSMSPGRKVWLEKELNRGPSLQNQDPFHRIHDDGGHSDDESLSSTTPQSTRTSNDSKSYSSPRHGCETGGSRVEDGATSDAKHVSDKHQTPVSASVDKTTLEMSHCLALFGVTSMNDLPSYHASDHIPVHSQLEPPSKLSGATTEEGTPLSGGSLRDLYWEEDPTDSFLRLSGAESQEEEVVFEDDPSSEDDNSLGLYGFEEDGESLQSSSLAEQDHHRGSSDLLHHFREAEADFRREDDTEFDGFESEDDNDSMIHPDGYATNEEEDDQALLDHNLSVGWTSRFEVLPKTNPPHASFQHSMDTKAMLTSRYDDNDFPHFDSECDECLLGSRHASAREGFYYTDDNSFAEEKKDEEPSALEKMPNLSKQEMQTAVEDLGSLIDQLRAELDNRKGVVRDPLSFLLPDDISHSQKENRDISSSATPMTVTSMETSTSNAFESATLSPSLISACASPASSRISAVFTPVVLPMDNELYDESLNDSIEAADDNETIMSYQTALTQQEEVDDICRKTEWMKKSLDALLEGNHSFGERPETDEHGRVNLGSFLRHHGEKQRLAPLTRKGTKRLNLGELRENGCESDSTTLLHDAGFDSTVLSNKIASAEKSTCASMKLELFIWREKLKVALKLFTKKVLHDCYLVACRILPYEWWTTWIWCYSVYQWCFPRKLQTDNGRRLIQYIAFAVCIWIVYSAACFLMHIRRAINTSFSNGASDIAPMQSPNEGFLCEFIDRRSYDGGVRI